MFDNVKQLGNPQISELVASICKLAGSMEGRATASEREESLHETLKLAYRLEEVMNKQDERIAYLDHLAMTDSLCGILNRRGFQMELQRVLASARRFNETGVLGYVDLDDFKFVNDTYGHACGDEVLKQVARILESETRSMDYIARLGGDEFAVLLVRTTWENGHYRIEKIAEEINNCMITFGRQQVGMKASIGMQKYDENSLSQDLMKAADASMYAIKKLKDGFKDEECLVKAAE